MQRDILRNKSAKLWYMQEFVKMSTLQSRVGYPEPLKTFLC